jgi:AsmA protein
MRRAAAWVCVAALAGVAAGSARWPLTPASVADNLNAAFGRAGQLTWAAPQDATFSAFPWPSLRVIDARLDNASGVNVLSAPEARIDLSLIDLSLGRVAPAQVTFVAPTITLDLDRSPSLGHLGAADAIGAISGFAPLGSVSVTNGVVRVVSRKRGLDTVIESVRGRYSGFSSASRVGIDVSAVWRDAPLVFSASLDKPRRAAEGKPSALNLSIASSVGDLAFTGAVTAGATPSAAGDLSASLHVLADAARLLGVTLPPVLGVGDIAISGRIGASPEDVILDEATITAGGQSLQGALRLARSKGRLSVSGSLDADHLSLSQLLGPFERPRVRNGAWSRKPLSIALPPNVDLDLRLSATQLEVYSVVLDNVAASALLRDGALTANLVEASAYGGHGEGELRMGCTDLNLCVAMRGKLVGADLGAAASALGLAALTGKGDADFAVETSGRSAAELIAGLRGKASLALAEGAISGVNLEEALRRSQRRPLDVTKDMRSGGSTFERITIDLLVGDGVAHVVKGALLARGLKADLQGDVDLGDREWNLRLNVAQAEASGAPSPDAARLSLDIDGPWSNPTVQPAGEPDNAQAGPPASTP